MKRICAITSVMIVCGCTHIAPKPFIVKNLDGWSRITEDYQPTVQIEIDAFGYPTAPKEVIDTFNARAILSEARRLKQPADPVDLTEEIFEQERIAILKKYDINKTVSLDRVRWQIHPDAPLNTVSWLTGKLRGIERSEFWTSGGIFIVSGPNYGGRRLPWLNKKCRDYVVTTGFQIFKNDKDWIHAKNIPDSANRIFGDLEGQTNMCFVNIYFQFKPSNTWSDVEQAFAAVLPRLDGMRGLWIGSEMMYRDINTKFPTNEITLHFHDVWKKEWN